jgi:hypothetical protein
MTTEDWQAVKTGTWLYPNEVPCLVSILKHGWSYGSGDYEDEPEIRDDREGEFYYIEYHAPKHTGESKSRVGAFDSLDEAVQAAVLASNGSVKWTE